MSLIEPLLANFVSNPLSQEQLRLLQDYLDLLLSWNAKINLTAIREPQEIVRRHFGESLFAGEQLRPENGARLSDLGSGAGFPGLPIAIRYPAIHVTLIESQQKKATFLREVVRSLGIRNVEIYGGRAENSGLTSQIVTLRAVEKFQLTLPVARSLVGGGGRLALLISSAQVKAAHRMTPEVGWQEPIAIPESRQRVLLMGLC
ncbi:MAG TPA: 16S rRNA (guanine(527)-N(7))-methyltransferase RsmG [Terriglobales bacterium]|nr:16S rRNA (guanine(527)-N(7))-methyltransferase RsmG [Terriglobales bacterium]